MPLFRKLVFVAALSGLLGGLFVTAVHQAGTVQTILKAETYEKAAETVVNTAPAAVAPHSHAPGTPAHEHAAHDHDAGAWAPADGFERTGYTALADILTGVGFALLLVCGYALLGQFTGRQIDWRQGLIWGLAGFVTFVLAPGLGLRPEVPGTESAPLLARQLWWLATVIATGAGLALLFFTRKPWLLLAAIALLVLPHVIGAPQPEEYRSLAPETLVQRFVQEVFVTSLLFWAVLGGLSGYFYQRLR